jgi:hypothetical protein
VTLSLQQVLLLGVFVTGLLLYLFEKALANEFKMLYIAHGLRHHSWRRRRLYLHYALFLRALTDRMPPVTRETITQLNSFAEIAGEPPPPESRLLQPAYIVPYIVLLNALILELLKQANLLQGGMGIPILIVSVLVLVFIYGVLRVWYGVTNWGQPEERSIQRFLRWADLDIEEEQLLRTQRLRAAAPGPHGPSH